MTTNHGVLTCAPSACLLGAEIPKRSWGLNQAACNTDMGSGFSCLSSSLKPSKMQAVFWKVPCIWICAGPWV